MNNIANYNEKNKRIHKLNQLWRFQHQPSVRNPKKRFKSGVENQRKNHDNSYVIGNQIQTAMPSVPITIGEFRHEYDKNNSSGNIDRRRH